MAIGSNARVNEKIYEAMQLLNSIERLTKDCDSRVRRIAFSNAMELVGLEISYERDSDFKYVFKFFGVEIQAMTEIRHYTTAQLCSSLDEDLQSILNCEDLHARKVYQKLINKLA